VYEFLAGSLAELGEGYAVINVQGVGYSVLVSRQCAARLVVGDEVQLRVHYHVTESSQALYGFYSPAERAMFRRLLQVNGVGPNSALGLLSSMQPEALARTILDEDLRALTAIKGVGKKTAERLVVELRDHLAELAGPADAGIFGSPQTEEADDLAQVLEGLGTPSRDARRLATAAREALGPDAEFQALLRQALQLAAG